VTGTAASGAAPLNVRWIHGAPSAKHDTDPEIQVFDFDPTTHILRQSMSVHYEAPFMFVFQGSRRSLLIDTGATPDPRWFPLRAVVDGIVGDGELLVLHTHSHRDHVAGDVQFRDRPRTKLVGAGLDELTAFLGFERWPDGTATVDLGDRWVDVIPSPGHDAAAVSFFDRATGLLLTGDTVYPGRLYVRDWDAYVATIRRLVALADSHDVSHVLGCHIEMTRTPGRDYKIRTTYQPDEPPLEMTVAQLRDVLHAVERIDGRPGEHGFEDFIVFNGIPDGYFG
jgi:glyoxylase-like metal-dependent hydrolase (beta-lactamase superfamily II)